MPTRPDPPAGWRAWLVAAVALLLLNASLTFANVWPTPKIRWQAAVSVELAVLVVLLALGAGRVRPLRRGVLPALAVVLVIGRYLDVTAPALYGRPFNLYWDSPHLGNVVAMFAESAPLWQLLLGGLVLLSAVAGAFIVLRAALERLAGAMQQPAIRTTLVVLAGVAVTGFVITRAADQQSPAPSAGLFPRPVTAAYVYQIRSVLSMIGPGAVAPEIGASPAALDATPDAVAGSDVYLVFVESYGAVTFDSPDLAAHLAPARAALAAAVQETGRQVVSAYVESPTFGGSSWLAHLSLLSGIAVRDPYSYQSLMTQERDTLVTTFARAGHRVVALMPGMRQPWPEGAFYGYDRIYGRRDLDYTGPQFGWWSIPDQYALARLDALEGPPSARAPLFVVFPTSTTHAPFGPVAPYQPDWSKVLGAEAYDPAEVERILARTPDWTNLSADYAHAMAYEFTTVAGYLRQRAGDDLVLILVGDHQPAAAVAGKDAPWTVPVHVVARDPAILTRLVAQGFGRGLTPARPSLGDLHELVPALLHAFEAQDR